MSQTISADVQMTAMQGKLETLLSSAVDRNTFALANIEIDNRDLQDRLVPLGSEEVSFHGNGKLITSIQGEEFDFNRHSLSQLSGKLNIPSKYMHDLQATEWGRGLSADILNEHAKEMHTDKTLLVRSVNGTARAFLSDKYRRYSGMEVYEAFLNGMKTLGAVFLEAVHSQQKTHFKAIIPEVHAIETENNGIEHVIFGAYLRDSLFGASSTEVRSFMMKLVCSNGMIGERQMRTVHIGKQIHDEGVFSTETLEYYTKYTASSVVDILGATISVDAIKARKERIQAISAEKIDIQKEIKLLPAQGLTSGEVTQVEAKLLANDPSTGVTGGATLLKLVNSINSVGNDIGGERSLTLQEICGNMASLN